MVVCIVLIQQCILTGSWYKCKECKQQTSATIKLYTCISSWGFDPDPYPGSAPVLCQGTPFSGPWVFSPHLMSSSDIIASAIMQLSQAIHTINVAKEVIKPSFIISDIPPNSSSFTRWKTLKQKYTTAKLTTKNLHNKHKQRTLDVEEKNCTILHIIKNEFRHTQSYQTLSQILNTNAYMVFLHFGQGEKKLLGLLHF